MEKCVLVSNIIFNNTCVHVFDFPFQTSLNEFLKGFFCLHTSFAKPIEFSCTVKIFFQGMFYSLQFIVYLQLDFADNEYSSANISEPLFSCV